MINRRDIDSEWREYGADRVQEMADNGETPDGWESYLMVKYANGYRYAFRKIEGDDILDFEPMMEEFIAIYRDNIEVIESITHRCVGAHMEATMYLDGQPPFAAYCWSSRGIWTEPNHEVA